MLCCVHGQGTVSFPYARRAASKFDVGFMLQINHQYAEQLSHLWTRAEGVTVELNAQHAATLTYMEAEDVYKTPCHFHQAPARSAVSTRRSTYYM